MVEPHTSIEQVLAHTSMERHPVEAASQLERLESREVLQVLTGERAAVRARVLLRMNRDRAAELLATMDDRLFAETFSHLDPAEGTPLLSRLDEEVRHARLAMLPPSLAKEYEELLSYPADSAGNLMDPRVMAFRTTDSVEFVLKRLRSAHNRRIVDVCVLEDDGTLVGMIPIQEIALVKPTRLLRELFSGSPVSVHMMAPREDVVDIMQKRNLASLPVVDTNGVLLGIIRYDKLVVAAQLEASEDLQTMFGAGRDERALSAVTFAVGKRLPWLQINLATAFLAALVVGLFEGTIAKFTALAVFLPVVAGQSGNTGSQALAVIMRGLALREVRARHWFKLARKEIAVGLLNGVVVALTTGLIVYFWMSSLGLGVIIAVAMVFSMTLAGFAGAMIPIILRSLGQDPAQSSSIVLTTVTDVVGFMSFLGLASLFASYLVVT